MRSRAFTLVELLAVIAVLAILAALLLPAFKGATLRSQEMKDVSNLRVIQEANAVYAADHDGWYVTIVSFDSVGASGGDWSGRPEFRQCLGIPLTGAWPDGLLSPRASLRDSDGTRPAARSYAMNVESLLDANSYGAPNYVRHVRTTQVTFPAKTIAVGDALDWQMDYSDSKNYAGVEVYVAKSMAFRYAGKAGVVFYDGHASLITRDEALADKSLWTIKR